MGVIFQSLGRTITAGVVLLLVILGLVAATSTTPTGIGSHAWGAFFVRWLHVLCGIMWVGLLWYFNLALIAINVGGSSGEPVEAETGCVAQRR